MSGGEIQAGRRQPARAHRGRQGAFAALVAGAAVWPELGDGLAAAYRSFDVAARRRLVDAVGSDAQAVGASPLPALQRLLAVERDPLVAAAIARWFGQPAQNPIYAAVRTGTTGQGAIWLFRQAPQGGDALKGLHVLWNARGGLEEAKLGPSLSCDELPAFLRSLGPGWSGCPADEAVDALAKLFWTHARGGEALPEPVKQFSDVFSL